MRVTSEFWVSALCRETSVKGAFAYVAKRGAKEAGAVFVIVNDMQGGLSLYAPAPQSYFDEESSGERLFEKALEIESEEAIREKLDREQKFDPDIWIVEIEDRDGRQFVKVAPPA